MLARTILLAATLGLPSAHALPTITQMILSVLRLAGDWMTPTQVERFVDQFADHTKSEVSHIGSRRALQTGESASFTPPPFTDNVSPEAYNGWLDTQEWRSFKSSIGKPGSRSTLDVELHYVTARCPATQPCTRGGVVISVGHTEPVDKYAEQISDLIKEGFSPVYAIDHRGQGRSGRMLSGSDTFKSHVERAADFVTDFRAFVQMTDDEMTRQQEGHGKRFLHCHSMGCAIAFTYLLDEYYAQRPNVFNAVAANAPLIQPLTDPFPYEVAVAIGKAMLAFGLDTYHPPTTGATFAELYCSDASCSAPRLPADRPDRQRIQYSRCHASANVEYAAGHVGLCLGDVTARFAHEFFGMFDTFDKYTGIHATKNSLAIPIRIQQARDVESKGHDGTVINTQQDRFCDHAGSACTLTRYPEAEHNIWFETDAIRSVALKEAYDFYDQHAGAVTKQKRLPKTCTWWEPWCASGRCSCVWSCSHPAARC